ncbi:pyridoxamine 5'-phosphate oxidase family protein [Halogeometricum sp. S1BR25-6]|uniref:Pyridoxamine 5'-phosphate oxidase family protein n=1 Tax=Halogeometricum salsisoli TaxID=2950536 RepID=A0ABU2GKC4_9EURY|nr:pyridoxamine 5'-phosphate oxidase family protein [Halogeometricum sp. S1BR25-6]MDS0300861.1 pyridoxamine 5'-phosphate oxidase family protein [Halogeometricum sp. S1BR25-6]
MDRIEYVYTFGMSDDEVDERLRSESAGVLSLADDGAAYGIPVSHYYDGDSLLFRLSDDDDDSRKLDVAEATTEASFVLFDADGPDLSWSVVVTGSLRRLSEEEQAAYDATELNERFGPLRVFDENVDEIDLVLYEMEISSLLGRRTDE